MSAAKVTAVRSVTLGVPDFRASMKFYTEIWGLSPVLELDGAVYLRGTGPYHHLLALVPRPEASVFGLPPIGDPGSRLVHGAC